MASPFRTWLQLFRAPNLFTVPGDPLAGFLLASFGVPGWQIFPAILASLCFYMAGLLDNDLADLAEDRRDRPSRPLPSGAARVATVRAVIVLLWVAAFAACTQLGWRSLYTAVALWLGITVYNRAIKHLQVIGALNMGACRGLSVLLGASAAPSQIFNPEALTAAAIVTAYIAAVTNLARHETRESAPRLAKLLPALMLLVGLLATMTWEPMGLRGGAALGWAGMRLLLLLAVVLAALIALRLIRQPRAPLPPAIGEFIRLLLVIQAAFCLHAGSILGFAPAMLLLVAWPISRVVSKRFYAS